MHARISTQFACTESELWQRLSTLESLEFVAAPLLGFTPIGLEVPGSEWEVGRDYRLKLHLFGFIPLGRHTIRLVKVDRDQRRISSRESGLLARVWNHDISFEEIQPGLVRYTDEIEIRAGWRTPLIWLFAHVFYRHRQRRWKLLLRKGLREGLREGPRKGQAGEAGPRLAE